MADVTPLRRPWFSLPGLADPPTEREPGTEAPKWSARPSLDGLRDAMEAARRDMDRADKAAYEAVEASKRYRDAFEVSRDDLLQAIEALNLFPTEPPAES